jgi:hypothetical protein
MDSRTTPSRRAVDRSGRTSSHRRRLTAARRPGLLLAVAAAGAVAVNVVTGVEPAAQADAAAEPVSIADELGLTARSESVDVTAELDPLEDLVASRSSREAAESAAQKSQAAADKAELDKQKAAAKAKAEAEKKAAAKAAATEAAKAAEASAAAEAEAGDASEEQAAEDAPAAAAEAPRSTAVSAVAQISNTSGAVAGVTQAAADAVVSNVPGAGSITLGGTRPSAADPGGHPSGKALDYMVMSDTSLGNAIVQYHIANWDALGVDYLIYQQRYLGSPGGSWSAMEDRGSPTANHFDHVHVNYR